jgi:rubredoxin
LNWIFENQKGQPFRKVKANNEWTFLWSTMCVNAVRSKVQCPQCATPYQLVERVSIPLYILSKADVAAHIAAPYITVLGLTCSVLISSTTYGAYAILTLFGPSHGERLLGRPGLWTWKTWIGLPMIPVVLIASRSRWADGILPFVAVLMVRASGGPQQMRITWPPSPAVTVGFLPWFRYGLTKISHTNPTYHGVIPNLFHS